jgi:hypothetical protein
MDTSAPPTRPCYVEIIRQYHDRYRLPIVHTVTNIKEGPCYDEAVK